MPRADGITVEIDDRELAAWLQHMQRQAGPDGLAQILEAIGAKMESRAEGRFDTKADPAGAPWAPHAPSTTSRYARSDKGKAKGSLLIREGIMRDSLSHQVEGDAVLIGFGELYAAYHELGTRRMPRRGLLTADPASGELGEGDRQSILDLLADHFGRLD